MTDPHALLRRRGFPRSNRYDPSWVLAHQMGPNPLWLAEWLTAAMPLASGTRVLDLGCGTALTSIFLAREFGVRVWAADLWVDPDANWQRVVAAGVADLVTPLRAEAHALPFAAGFFDAVVSIDAYAYFGTDQLYLPYLARFVREGGRVGMASPGLMQPLPAGGAPAHLLEAQANGASFWEPECSVFHTAGWWRDLWATVPQVEVETADSLSRGWELWRDFELALEAAGGGLFPSVAESLERDGGRWLGFVRAVARRVGEAGVNLYEAGLHDRLLSERSTG